MYFPPEDCALLSWSQGRQWLDALAQSDAQGLQQARETWAEIAKGLEGFGAVDLPPGCRHAYQDIVGPGEEATMRAAMCSMSGCGLTAACVMRCGGVRSARLEPPYAIGSAIDRLFAVAQQWHAVVEPGGDWGPVPLLGDIVLHGAVRPVKPKDPSPEQLSTWQRAVETWQREWGGEAHVFMITEVDGLDRHSMDGGQVHPTLGGQAILGRARTLHFVGGKLWLGPRRVQRWIDCTKLRTQDAWTYPIANWPQGYVIPKHE